MEDKSEKIHTQLYPYGYFVKILTIFFFSNDEKIGCITVSVLPLRAEIELHNRKYWDALVNSLQSSIIREINDLEKYIEDSMQVLNTQPRTMSEVGEAHSKHAQILKASDEVSRQCF